MGDNSSNVTFTEGESVVKQAQSACFTTLSPSGPAPQARGNGCRSNRARP